MKLFNTKINLNFIKNSAKFLILAFLIIYCIYILYFSSLKTVESFANTYDCSKCEVKPTSGNCIKIYDFSYTIARLNDGKIDISFDKLDTNFIFCPWESNNCFDNSDNYRTNMLNQNSRIGICNEDLESNMNKGLNNVRCCSGTGPFYASETQNYYTIFDNFNTINNITANCDKFDMDLSNNFVYPKREYDYLTSIQKSNLGYVLDQTNYAKVKNFCLNHDKTHKNYIAARSNTNNFTGIIFKKDISGTGHILKDPRLRKPGLNRKTIIDNIISKQQLIDISNGAIKEEKQYKLAMKTTFDYRENDEIIDVSNSFYQVIDKHNQRLNQLKIKNISDANFNQTLTNILNDLVKHYNHAQSNYNNNYEIYNYTPYKNDINQASKIQKPNNYNSTYILNENEFLNCIGEIESPPDLSFNFTASGDFFGSSDPTLTTIEQASPNNYGPSGELEMELRRLQNVPPGGNAPVGVINQYLNAINGFYERHIANMLGPKTHTPNNQLVFENDNLEIKTPTFFKYETDPNNKYECQPSITGNDKFKDCGPTAYYTDFKP